MSYHLCKRQQIFICSEREVSEWGLYYTQLMDHFIFLQLYCIVSVYLPQRQWISKSLVQIKKAFFKIIQNFLKSLILVEKKIIWELASKKRKHQLPNLKEFVYLIELTKKLNIKYFVQLIIKSLLKSVSIYRYHY